ncbi:MAG: short-chain fatty acyl-CoA regulator family protein [Paracoccaceae bacterium]
MPATISGARLRERRQELGLRQAEVAAGAGISASYLNLIEHDRRRAAGEVLLRLAASLGIESQDVAGPGVPALAEDLRAAAAAAGGEAELDRAEDLVRRFPGWAEVLSRLHRRAEGLGRAVEALNDRMTHDPHLSATMHEVLSAVASVRSTAAILAETEDLDPDWQRRFHRNLDQDSARLAEGAQALVAWLDASDREERLGIAAPQEEVEAWLAEHGWQPGGATGALASGSARSLAQAWNAQAAADARLLPLDEFTAALEGDGADPLRLAARFGAPVLAVFRRIATLPDSGLGLVACDASGTLTFRKPAAHFPLPRFGAACPLWPLYAALGRPMLPVEAIVKTAGRDGRRFRILAFCEPRFPAGFSGPELREAGMLILPDDDGAGPALPVGSTCRVCPREACAARREPSILSDAA